MLPVRDTLDAGSAPGAGRVAAPANAAPARRIFFLLGVGKSGTNWISAVGW